MRDQNIEVLKTAILADRVTRRGPFSIALRERLTSYVVQASSDGQSIEKISDELGLCSKTVHGWLSRVKGGQLRKVEVVSERPSRKFSLRGPVGTSLDGLSLDEVITVWKRLGC